MKTFHICSRAALEQHWNTHFHVWHGLELPDGRILVTIRFTNANRESEWTQHPEVDELPHPFSTDVISSNHHKALKHLGVQPNDTMQKTAKKLAKINPMMAL